MTVQRRQGCCVAGHRGGAFNVAVRELLNFYVAMEEFVMEEDIHKAMSIREHAAGNLTTSMVGVVSCTAMQQRLTSLCGLLCCGSVPDAMRSLYPQICMWQVDDVFFVLARCGRRALGTASTACVCAVLGQANALLGSAYSPQLRAKLEVSGSRCTERLAATRSAGGIQSATNNSCTF